MISNINNTNILWSQKYFSYKIDSYVSIIFNYFPALVIQDNRIMFFSE